MIRLMALCTAFALGVAAHTGPRPGFPADANPQPMPAQAPSGCPSGSALQPAPGTVAGITIPAGTVITIMMIDSIDSSRNHAGEQFAASVDDNVVVGDRVPIQKGANAWVRLTEARSSGRFKGRAELQLELMALMSKENCYNVESSAYEQHGGSRGKQSAKRIGGLGGLGAAIGAVAGGGLGAGIGAAAGAGTGAGIQVLTHGEKIRIPSETKIDFTLKNPVTITTGQPLTASAPSPTAPPAMAPVIASFTPISPQAAQTIVIKGSGFGSQPAFDGDSPALMIDNLTRNWRAGCRERPECGGGDNAVTVRVPSWQDGEIHIDAFTGSYGSSGWVLNPMDQIQVSVWNAQTGTGPATYALTVSPSTNGSGGQAGGLEGTTISVPGRQAWTATGIDVSEGSQISISATGQVNMAADGHIPPMPPSGFPPDCTAAAKLYGAVVRPFPAPQLPCWSLIGRIGDNGAIFEVGTGSTVQARQSGQLYLGVNDSFFDDNSGTWTANVQVSGPQPGPIPQGQSPATATGTDATIVSNINGKLWQDETLKALDIRVASQNGAVTLTGTVKTELQKAAVERLARSEQGVSQVIDQLVVAPSHSSPGPGGGSQAGNSTAPPGAPAIAIVGGVRGTGIRKVDFRNFDYSSDCGSQTGPRVIHVSKGEWRGAPDDPSAGYVVIADVLYGDLVGAGQEQAVIHAACNEGANFDTHEMLVYMMSSEGVRLLTKLPPSDWSNGEVTEVHVRGKQLAVSYPEGGSHAQPDWIVTVRLQWNGSSFVRVASDRKKFTGWPRR